MIGCFTGTAAYSMSIFTLALERRDRPSPLVRASTTSGRWAWFSIDARSDSCSNESPTTRPSSAMKVTRADSSSPMRMASS